MIIVLVALGGCIEQHPGFVEPVVAGGGTSQTSSTTAAAASEVTTGGGTQATSAGSAGGVETGIDPDTTGANATWTSATTTATATVSSGSEGGVDSGSSTSAAATSGGSGGLGSQCVENADCSAVPGTECCGEDRCEGTCMTPCSLDSDCTAANTACESGHCLFTCDAPEDCSPYAGFACDADCKYCVVLSLNDRCQPS